LRMYPILYVNNNINLVGSQHFYQYISCIHFWHILQNVSLWCYYFILFYFVWRNNTIFDWYFTHKLITNQAYPFTYCVCLNRLQHFNNNSLKKLWFSKRTQTFVLDISLTWICLVLLTRHYVYIACTTRP